MKTIPYLFLVSLVMASCKGQEPKSQVAKIVETTAETVVKPIKGLELKDQVFSVSGTKASVIDLPNGGRIEFPDNAFVDSDGNPVKGEVDIHWKEYHSLTDIMLSGIPMKYDSLGVKYDFVSGGMFDISATKNNEEVNLAKGKKANVTVESISDTPCYNFYALDEKTGAWDYKTTKTGVPVEKPNSVPGSPTEKSTTKSDEKSHIFDAQVNTKAFPELQNQMIVGWKSLDKVSRGDKRWMEKSIASTSLNPGEIKGEYNLSVTIGKDSKNYKVKPYTLQDAKADKPRIEKKLEADYKALFEYQKNVSSGLIVRSIEIEGFGIYNWDIVCSRKTVRKLVADFDFPNNENPKMVSLFLISPEENAIVAYKPEDWALFSFDPTKKNCIVGILPDNSLVSVGNAAFVSAAKSPGGAYTFELEKTGIKVTSGKDIAKYLDKLI